MRLFLLIASLCIGTCLSQNSCPSKEDIKPCICKKERNARTLVTCEGLSSANALRSAIKGMKNYQFSSFNVEKSNIGVLPADMFSNIGIEVLNILYTNITSISEGLNRPPFLGLERSLESLEIRDAFRSDKTPLTRISLAHLKKLIFLQLEGNIMPVIGNDWFESGPYGLRELYLFDSSTAKLGSHAFMALGQLRKIAVTGGSISEISREMFPKPARFLESLDFSNNQLESLPKDMFSRMPSLMEVYFDNNALGSISEVSFSPIWSQLSHVFFEGNPLKCDGNMKWIYKYRLPESIQGRCAFPEVLRSRSLSNLTLADFA